MKALLRQLTNKGASLSVLVLGGGKFAPIGRGKPEEDFGNFLENNEGKRLNVEVLESDSINEDVTFTDIRVVEFNPKVTFVREATHLEKLTAVLGNWSQEEITEALAVQVEDYSQLH